MSIKSLTISDTNNGLGERRRLQADHPPASSSAGISVSRACRPAPSAPTSAWAPTRPGPTLLQSLHGERRAQRLRQPHDLGHRPGHCSPERASNTGGVVSKRWYAERLQHQHQRCEQHRQRRRRQQLLRDGQRNPARYTGGGAQTASTHRLWIDQAQTGSTFDITNPAGALTWNPGGGTVNKNITKTGPGSLTLGGTVNGTMAVAVNQGTLTFTGNAIDYTGATTVSGGRLVLYNNDDTWTSGLNTSPLARPWSSTAITAPYEHPRLHAERRQVPIGKDRQWRGQHELGIKAAPWPWLPAGSSMSRREPCAWNTEQSNWASNLSDLTVDSGATFDLWDLPNAGVFVDSLNGAGTITRTSFARPAPSPSGWTTAAAPSAAASPTTVGVIGASTRPAPAPRRSRAATPTPGRPPSATACSLPAAGRHRRRLGGLAPQLRDAASPYPLLRIGHLLRQRRLRQEYHPGQRHHPVHREPGWLRLLRRRHLRHRRLPAKRGGGNRDPDREQQLHQR